jgi:hypothetical protein
VELERSQSRTKGRKRVKNSASLLVPMDRKDGKEKTKYNRSSRADNPENSKVGRRNDRSATNE